MCTNQIAVPSKEQRDKIISVNHCSALGRHKSVTKIYERVKQISMAKYETKHTEIYLKLPKLLPKETSLRKDQTTNDTDRYFRHRIRQNFNGYHGSISCHENRKYLHPNHSRSFNKILSRNFLETRNSKRHN